MSRLFRLVPDLVNTKIRIFHRYTSLKGLIGVSVVWNGSCFLP